MPDRSGQQLENYRLIRLLGSGKFGEVYLAENIHRGKQFAIKILQARLNVGDLLAFLKEVRTLLLLRHSNIVQIVDFSVDGPFPFIVMDYAPNGTLRERYPRGTRLPLTTIVSYVKQIADALQYAHEEGLVHRDVKPENMLLGPNNEVLLSDFGIVTMSTSLDFPDPQKMAGTPLYMAPEQISEQPVRASDQYALGAIVYEWLCGTPPFQGTLPELSIKHITVPPPSLRAKDPTISSHVEYVVMTALAKNPQERFAKVRAFATALEQASRMEVSLLPTEILAPTALAQLPIVVAQPSPPAPKSEIGTTICTYQGHTEQVQVIVWSPDGTQIASASCNGPVQVWNAATGDKIAVYDNHSRSIDALTWTSTGMRIASANSDRSVQVWNAATGDIIIIYENPKGAGRQVRFLGRMPIRIVWSPDGIRIAATETIEGLLVWNADTGECVFTQSGYFATVAWSLNGKYVVTGTGLRRGVLQRLGNVCSIEVWDTTTGKSISRKGEYSRVNAVAISPDGTRVAASIAKIIEDQEKPFVVQEMRIEVWNTTTGDNIFAYNGHSGVVNALAWSLNGTRIASGGDDKTVQVWKATTSGHIFTYDGHAAPVTSMVWSPDGTRLASVSYDGVIQVWRASPKN